PATPDAAAAPAGADLTLDIAEGPLRLSTVAAKVLYLDFWASWCAPCRLSFAWMARMHDRYAGQGLAIVAVGLDRKTGDAERFLQAQRPPFRIALDPEAGSARAYAVAAMPSSVMMRGGTLETILRHAGFRPSDEAGLEAAIVRALQA
ncbi:MAG: TlpA family protein disulfide reductase, partial [Rubrivivax sp.]|nr:TlpA family protein disulfide reductase [Rubrivivax sp.]